MDKETVDRTMHGGMKDDNYDSDESDGNYHSVTMLIVDIFTLHQQE